MENDVSNADYAAMYQRMMKATEKAIRTLIEAQQECEEIYIRTTGNNTVIKLDDHRGGK